MQNELITWKKILKEHENELNELNKPIDVTKMSCYDIDQRIERKIQLEQLIKEDKEIISDIRKELTITIEKNQEYKGEHPIEEKHYYENLLTQKGIIEPEITDIRKTKQSIIIEYE